MLESRTVSQQQDEYATLEPFWDGGREARGEVVGLSRYEGRSSLYHSVNWEQSDDLERRQDNRLRKAEGFAPVRGLDRGPRAKNHSNDPAILAMLKKGCSYNGISRDLGVSVSVVRRVGRANGIDRRGFQNTKQL